MHLDLTPDQALELGQVAEGALAPLDGFMGERDFLATVEDMRLADGSLFPLPVVLDLDEATARRVGSASRVDLNWGGTTVGHIEPAEAWTVDKSRVVERIYGTAETAHPGVRFFMEGGDWFVGGRVGLTDAGRELLFPDGATPDVTRRRFAEKGWTTVAGFQTRNVPHRAHEQLQRVALEHVDGLFIQPLVGRKKAGDYTPEAIVAGYRALISEFYPTGRVEFGVLRTAMRYAGPREAVFHALIRRNYGCTHFIVGRDHAGVGSYYGKYDAQRLAIAHAEELGVRIMPLNGPYHCRRCDGIVSEASCRHLHEEPDAISHISGTDVRAYLRDERTPPSWVMRTEVFAALAGLELFIAEDGA